MTNVSIAKSDLELLLRAADLLCEHYDRKAFDLEALSLWGLSKTRVPTDEERKVAPDVDEIVEISDALWDAMTHALELTNVELPDLDIRAMLRK